jgi:hypothetical protein
MILGKVKAGEKVGCIFTYTNTVDADLVITSAIGQLRLHRTQI